MSSIGRGREGVPVVLVVIADAALARLVGHVLDELDLVHVDVPTWRDGVAWLDSRPSLAIYDIDQHPSADYAGLTSILERGWGERVPLILLSRTATSARVAGDLGSATVLCVPIKGGELLASVEELLGMRSGDS